MTTFLYSKPDDLYFGEYHFKLTSIAFPEQYNVYKNDEQVAYVRLRHGHLTVEIPDACDENIFYVLLNDKGEFDSREERSYHLSYIAKTIGQRLRFLEMIEGSKPSKVFCEDLG